MSCHISQCGWSQAACFRKTSHLSIAEKIYLALDVLKSGTTRAMLYITWSGHSWIYSLPFHHLASSCKIKYDLPVHVDLPNYGVIASTSYMSHNMDSHMLQIYSQKPHSLHICHHRDGQPYYCFLVVKRWQFSVFNYNPWNYIIFLGMYRTGLIREVPSLSYCLNRAQVPKEEHSLFPCSHISMTL